jgi:hypothetical protein
MSMFMLDLPNEELILKMPANEGLVKIVVAELGLSEWQNASGRREMYKVGLVELLTLHAEWVREQWMYHLKNGGTPMEYRQNTPKKGEKAVMLSNAPRINFLETTARVVREIAARLNLASTRVALTIDTPLAPGEWIYYGKIRNCPVSKVGHFTSNQRISKSKTCGKNCIRQRYERGPPALGPHAEFWKSLEDFTLVAVVRGTMDDERALHAELKRVAQDLDFYVSPGAMETHDNRLHKFILRCMREIGDVMLATAPTESASEQIQSSEPAGAAVSLTGGVEDRFLVLVVDVSPPPLPACQDAAVNENAAVDVQPKDHLLAYASSWHSP